ncbi:hypothetical protein D3C83_161210 [compost metagenome]
MRVFAPQERRVRHLGEMHIVHELRAAREQARVLIAADGLPDEPRHGLFARATASFTASTMFA